MNPAHEGPLDEADIRLVPSAYGAYRLWHAARVVYVGMTIAPRTLRSELLRHWRGDFGSHTQRASRFDCLVASGAGEAHALYLSLYVTSGWRDSAVVRTDRRV